MSDILVPISPGELFDKITILRIKAERFEEPVKLGNVRHELAQLEHIWQQTVGATRQQQLAADCVALQSVNAALWDIEDRIRDHEAAGRFDADFIELARAVYLRNDERAAIKRRINLQLNSAIIEEKSYRPYARQSG
jgi:hypothetical protein